MLYKQHLIQQIQQLLLIQRLILLDNKLVEEYLELQHLKLLKLIQRLIQLIIISKLEMRVEQIGKQLIEKIYYE
jgi:hypothetical protein